MIKIINFFLDETTLQFSTPPLLCFPFLFVFLFVCCWVFFFCKSLFSLCVCVFIFERQVVRFTASNLHLPDFNQDSKLRRLHNSGCTSVAKLAPSELLSASRAIPSVVRTFSNIHSQHAREESRETKKT